MARDSTRQTGMKAVMVDGDQRERGRHGDAVGVAAWARRCLREPRSRTSTTDEDDLTRPRFLAVVQVQEHVERLG